MMDWLQQHYKILAGIAVPIILTVIGLFKKSPKIKKWYLTKGNKNIIKDSDNTSQIVVYGDNVVNNKFGLKEMKALSQGIISAEFPHVERAFNTLRTNSFNFLNILNDKIEPLLRKEVGKFSEADVQIALRSAINSAARTSEQEVHNTLAKLIIDRVQKPTRPIAELAIDESIAIVSKLNTNLIKMLSLSFMFSKTRYVGLPYISDLFEKMNSIVEHFSDLEVSTPKFEYLAAISCGTLSRIMSDDLCNIILASYQHLFIDEIPSETITALDLQDNIKSTFFDKQNNGKFKLNSALVRYLFDEVSESPPVKNKTSVFLNAGDKDKIKNLCNKHKLTKKQVESLLCEKIDGFSHIIKMWNANGFPNFFLTAVGIAVGRAYLEQAGFGNYDINTWIH